MPFLEVRSSATSIPAAEMVSVPTTGGRRICYSRWDLELEIAELMEFVKEEVVLVLRLHRPCLEIPDFLVGCHRVAL